MGCEGEAPADTFIDDGTTTIARPLTGPSSPPEWGPTTPSNLFPPMWGRNVSVAAKVRIGLEQAVSASSISTTSFFLRTSAGASVPSRVSFNSQNSTATLDPVSPLAYSTTYVATLDGARAASGEALPRAEWSFTTAPAPHVGPGGPIAIVTSASHPFSRYYAEILRAEGLNAFTTIELSALSPALLDTFDVVILGHMPLSAGQVTAFSDWVNRGGKLIAMRPDLKLASLLGIRYSGGAISDAYLKIDTASGAGVGITDAIIQYHGTSDTYRLVDATPIGMMVKADGQTVLPNPLITQRPVGSAGGQAVAFTYDLARSVATTRQGNPAWQQQDRDGDGVIRPNDLFFGGTAPHWVDFSKIQIPQADEQQRLLANIVLKLAHDRKPLPRFWYFPNGHKAVVVMTGDDHSYPGATRERFDGQAVNSAGAFNAASGIRSSVYLYTRNNPLTDSIAAKYQAWGFEVGLHVEGGNATGWTSYAQCNEYFVSQLGPWKSAYPSLPTPSTNRTHRVIWSDYSTLPNVEFAHRIRLDTTYYHFWGYRNVAPFTNPGLFTGSAMPMRFTFTDGTLIDTYQAATHMTDESGQAYPLTINTLLDNALGPKGYYGAFTANMHSDKVASNGTNGANAIVASARARDVPVISAQQLLEWLDARNGSAFRDISWGAGTLRFSIVSGAGAHGLTGMLPRHSTAGTLSQLVHQSRGPLAFRTEVIKGIEYALFPGEHGAYEAHYAP